MTISVDLHTIVIFATAIATMFVTTFLRGFQNKNVAGGYMKFAGVTGYAMAVCDMLTVSLIVKGGMTVAFVGAFGAAAGWMAGMYVHKALLKKREAERARLKKLKKKNKRDEHIIALIQEQLNQQQGDY